MRHRIRIAAAAVILATYLASPAAALDASDRQALQDVVTRQLDAFRRDDASAAYGLAAPMIQQMFPDQDRFMTMVRDGYKPVYRARRHTFTEIRELGGDVEQVVRIEDADGLEWDAIYSFERQADGSWRISGCRLVKAPDQSV